MLCMAITTSMGQPSSPTMWAWALPGEYLYMCAHFYVFQTVFVHVHGNVFHNVCVWYLYVFQTACAELHVCVCALRMRLWICLCQKWTQEWLCVRVFPYDYVITILCTHFISVQGPRFGKEDRRSHCSWGSRHWHPICICTLYCCKWVMPTNQSFIKYNKCCICATP